MNVAPGTSVPSVEKPMAKDTTIQNGAPSRGKVRTQDNHRDCLDAQIVSAIADVSASAEPPKLSTGRKDAPLCLAIAQMMVKSVTVKVWLTVI